METIKSCPRCGEDHVVDDGDVLCPDCHNEMIDLIRDQEEVDFNEEDITLQDYLPEEQYDDKFIALAKHTDYSPKEISEDRNNLFTVGKKEFLVCTDDEADDLWDESLDNYLEECVLPEIAENVRFYFDREAWKKDARMDGRGHSLSPYDGNEYDVEVNNTTYYIYRIN